jgi:hypothetical protein
MNIAFHTPGGPLKDFVEYIGFLSGNVIGNGVAFPRSNQVIIINIGDHFSISDVYLPGSAKTEVGHIVWINGKQGLPDQSHFIRDFKERAGITPLQYRRLCQQFPAIRTRRIFFRWSRKHFYNLFPEACLTLGDH